MQHSAAEANRPGKVSERGNYILSDMDSEDISGEGKRKKKQQHCTVILRRHARTHAHKSQKMKNTIKSGGGILIVAFEQQILLAEQERNKI